MTAPELPPGASEAALPEAVATGEDTDALLAQLIEGILAQSRPEIAEAIMLAAIPFWVDRPLLMALRAKNDGLDDKILERLGRFSFITLQAGRLVCNRDVLRLLRLRWRADPAGFVAANQRALNYFQAQLAAAGQNSVLSEEAAQACLFHTLAVDPTAGITLLNKLVSDAGAEHRLAAAERYLAIAEEQHESRAARGPGIHPRAGGPDERALGDQR